MIKIIEEKPVPREKVKCSNCGSLLEYGNADLREDCHNPANSSSRDHLFKDYIITCPVCGCNQLASWITK